MAQTKSRNGGRKKTDSRSTPDLMAALGKKRGPGRPPKHRPTRTAEQIADALEAEVRKLQGVADILRGKL